MQGKTNRAMPNIDPTFRLSDFREFLDASLKEFGERIAVLLGAAADQYLVSRNIIKHSPRGSRMAVQVIKSLNTEERRNNALSDLLKHLKPSGPNDTLELLAKCLELFVDKDLRDGVCFRS